jgi:hypothetical protein
MRKLPDNWKDITVLYAYSYYDRPYKNIQNFILRQVKRLEEKGFKVVPFCLTIDPPNNPLQFPELDKRWNRGDKKLLKLYEAIEQQVEKCDVLLNVNGINLHPEFVEQLQVYTVFQCFDDYAGGDYVLSKPVASSYDLCSVGNIAEVETYYKMGAKKAFWQPLGYLSEMYDPNLTYEDILSRERDINLFMLIDRLPAIRRERLDKLYNSFPNAHFYGNGWPRGFLSKNLEVEYLQRAKISPNIHWSSGPICYRTFYTPANGILQICDNKKNLGKIFELDKEVIGFDSIEECIEKCHYYLKHDDERRQIAANGWLRATKDYNEIAIYERLLKTIHNNLPPKEEKEKVDILKIQRKITLPARIKYYINPGNFITINNIKRITPKPLKQIIKRIGSKLFEKQREFYE